MLRAFPGNFPLRFLKGFHMNKNIKAGLVAAGVMFVSGAASAALPAEATTAFTSLQGNVTDVLAAVWPIIGAVVAGFGLVKLFKRGASKI